MVHDIAEERRSRQVAEAARESEWQGRGFMRDLFLGKLELEMIAPYPQLEEPSPEYLRFYDALDELLRDRVDPERIDELGEYPRELLSDLKRLGAFGMKIPKEYGGLGFNQREYGRLMQLCGSRDANVTSLLSAHQSIGVPQPLKLFGSEALKRAYLPRCAAGAISAFALTETTAGSDPARLTTTATPTEDGRAFILDGEKLWCTNGTLAELVVVMARNPIDNAISAFVVETAWPGVQVTKRLRFMGLRALANGVLRFRGVRVPRENLIGAEGKGLKIALTTLNTGRLTLPASVTGGAKTALELARKWANARVQWGQPIGKHEAIAHELAELAAVTYAMESLSELAQALADEHGYDIRLEAAAAKEWNTVQAWHVFDTALQIRGGRGYETAASLASRGEPPIGVERWLRDARIFRIFEGSSEVMHLFMAREAVDKHLQVAGVLIDPEVSWRRKLAALPRIAAFYFVWYVGLWLGALRPRRYARFGALADHLRFVRARSRKLARQIFHGMVRFGAAAERRQAFLFRVVDVAIELLVMCASVTRAARLRELGRPEANKAQALAELFCRSERRKVDDLFARLWRNDDRRAYAVGRDVLDGDHIWLEQGAVGLGYGVAELTPRPPEEGEPPRERAVPGQPAPFA